MEQTIYGDVLFLINFSMDFLSLFITAKFLHYRVRLIPLLFAAAIGALYGVAELFLGLGRLFSVIISAAVAILMCYISFGGIHLLRTAAVFYGTGFLLGGCMTAIYSLLGGLIGGGIWMIDDRSEIGMSYGLPLGAVLPIAVISVLFSLISNRLIGGRTKSKRGTVTAVYEDKSVTLSALVDSGNLLTEPISGDPVIITGADDLNPILPETLIPLFESLDPTALASVPSEHAMRIRLISARSASGSDLFIGFRPDDITVNGKSYSAYLAVNGRKGSYNGADALVPTALVD